MQEIVLIVRTSTALPHFSIREDADDDRLAELMEAYTHPKTSVRISCEHSDYRVLDHGVEAGRKWFILVRSVPLH